MNKERLNERRAKEIVQRELGISLDHSDKNGGVDYRSQDGSIAVEVTRVTDEDVRRGLRALSESDKSPVTGTPLRACWLVFTSQTAPGLKTLKQRVHPLVAQLEQAGLNFFFDQRAQRHLLQGREHANLYHELLQMKVERALASPDSAAREPDHQHRVYVAVGGGGSASGSNEAVALLSEALAATTDNVGKLTASGAPQRHLFVWIDGATPFAIERALSHRPPSWDDDGGNGFGLPTESPTLDPAFTHLWVVHEGSGRGWLWDGEAWRSLEDDRSEPQ
ncbi:hypothetical protein L2091_01635 [Curtobacterium albidum]|uniref:hypothetical protein n=1 Tax=Curtobacterium citreum TaxID=2036 RepID=UPI0020275B6F|nr:hypothetical protein [Curtobacterium albidum]MCL9663930.1 hypothetical protein [Curtobacterium albidum]